MKKVHLDSAIGSPYRSPYDGSFKVGTVPTTAAFKSGAKSQRVARLAERVAELSGLQQTLYANNPFALLLIFQTLDAAEKDSTIHAVLTAVDPAVCGVHAFKCPSVEEIEHDFLWRTSACLPARGPIGEFNRR